MNPEIRLVIVMICTARTDLPDLVVHPSLYGDIVEQYDLSSYFNVYGLNDLTVRVDTPVVGVTDALVAELRVILEPYYASKLEKRSGMEPRMTSYWFDEPMPLYSIEQNGPRYVIWTRDDPLTVCATYVDRVERESLYEAVERAKQWYYPVYDEYSVIVFDLDDTLIDSRLRVYDRAQTMLEHAKRVYDRVVLWSHGTAPHVEEFAQRFADDSVHGESLFDLVLCYGGEPDRRANKSLLHLYNFMPNCRFVKATLVDDSISNWTPEYTKAIVPSYRQSCRLALQCLV